MKKTISILLVLCLCVGLCACSARDDIKGKWVWVGDDTNTMTFMGDGTCVYSSGNTCKYSFNPALGVITIHSSVTVNYTVTREDGVTKLRCGETLYVRQEDYAAAHDAYEAEKKAASDAQMQVMKEEFYAQLSDEPEKLELGKAYSMDDYVITFLSYSVGAYVEDHNQYTVEFQVRLENTSEEQICMLGGLNQEQERVDTDVEDVQLDCYCLVGGSNQYSKSQNAGKLEFQVARENEDQPVYLQPHTTAEYTALLGFSSGTQSIGFHQELPPFALQYMVIHTKSADLFLDISELL